MQSTSEEFPVSLKLAVHPYGGLCVGIVSEYDFREAAEESK